MSIDPHSAVTAARSYRAANGAAILAQFRELLSLPNVSVDLRDVAVNADAIAELLRARHLDVKLLELPGAAPIVTGRIESGDDRPTIGIYAHYDGQPIDQANWTTPPFDPTLMAGDELIPFPDAGAAVDPDWRIHARSAADDKAPIIALASALDGIAAAGLSPSPNMVLLFEGEEEIGSPHLPEYLAAHRDWFAADLWLICDGPVH